MIIITLILIDPGILFALVMSACRAFSIFVNIIINNYNNNNDSYDYYYSYTYSPIS